MGLVRGGGGKEGARHGKKVRGACCVRVCVWGGEGGGRGMGGSRV